MCPGYGGGGAGEIVFKLSVLDEIVLHKVDGEVFLAIDELHDIYLLTIQWIDSASNYFSI